MVLLRLKESFRTNNNKGDNMNKTLLVSAAVAGLMMASAVHADDPAAAPGGAAPTAEAGKDGKDHKCKGAHKCKGKHHKKGDKDAPAADAGADKK